MRYSRVNELLDQIAPLEQSGEEVSEAMFDEVKAEMAATGAMYVQLYLYRAPRTGGEVISC